MLAVAVHEQHRAAPGMVEPRHQGGFLAEIARQRHHLNVERRRRQARAQCRAWCRRCRRRHRRLRRQGRSAAAASWRARQAARAERPARLPRCRAGTTIDSPCAAALAAVVDRPETSVAQHHRSGSKTMPRNSICYSPPAVATMNETAFQPSLPQERLEPGEQRIVAVEHIVERRHRHRLGAMLAQESCRARKAAPAGSAASPSPTRSARRTARPRRSGYGLPPAARRRSRQSGCGLRGICWRGRGRRCDRG